MTNTTIVRYVNGKAYAVRIDQGVAERFGLVEGGEVPLPILLYLLYIGKAKVVNDKNKEVSFEDLVKLIKDPDTFSIFIVFYDLAKKGKRITLGDSSRELVLIDEKIKVYVLDEDSYISADDMYKLVDRAIKQEYRLIIAIVDINGEITYYEVNKTDFPKIERR